MNKNEIDAMWQKAMKESIKDGEMYTRYHFAKMVAEAEREACALLCYEQRKNWDALACADAIRAGTRPRGQA